MSLPLESVPRRYQRRADGIAVVPFLALGRDEAPFRSALARAIAVMEGLVERSRPEAKPEALDACFPQALGGYRAGRAVWACLLERYRFHGPTLPDLLGHRAAGALLLKGMETPAALRRWVLTRLGRSTGFTARRDRERTLSVLAHELGVPDVPPEAMDAALWSDGPDAETLERAGDLPDTDWLLHRFRRRVLEALLFHTRELRLHLPTGGAWRAAYRTAKLLHLAAEPEPGSMITLQAWPVAFMERGTGARLADAAIYLLSVHGARGYALVDLNRQPYVLALDDALAGALPAAAAPPVDFDSTVEARLYRGVQALGPARRGWTVEREPPALVAGEGVLIPDFLFRRGELTINLEVVGFWTEEYRRRKLTKLRALARDLPGLRLALAVDQSLPGFDDLPFPVLPYRQAIDPEALLRFLEVHFDDPAARLPGIVARLHALVEARGEGPWLVPAEELAGALGCYGVADAEEALAQLALPGPTQYLPGAGLCSSAFFGLVRAVLAEAVPAQGAGQAAVAVLLAERLGFAGDLETLIRTAGGYDLHRQSLLEATIVPAGWPPPEPSPDPPKRRARPANRRTA